MSRWTGAAALVLLLGLSAGFAALNGGRSVTIEFGLFRLSRVPISLVVFGSLLLGMLVMLAVGVQSDLKVRRILRGRLESAGSGEVPPEVDRFQQDLFVGDDPEEPPP